MLFAIFKIRPMLFGFYLVRLNSRQLLLHLLRIHLNLHHTVPSKKE